MSKAPSNRPRVGVSACLLGERVRYDGAHKLAAHLVAGLGQKVEWVAVCPEVEAGFGVPRPAMQLEQQAGGVRLIAIESKRDHSERMRQLAATRVRELLALPVSGYVLKTRSPSCGLHSVPLHGQGGGSQLGRGLFAETLIAACPDLPVADEEELADAERCADFLARVVGYGVGANRNA